MADRDAVLREIVERATFCKYKAEEIEIRGSNETLVEIAVREAWDAALEHAAEQADELAQQRISPRGDTFLKSFRDFAAALRQQTSKGGKG